MARKRKNTSISVRSLVIFHREKGKTLREIGRILNLSHSTVQYICKRYYLDDRIEDKPRPGRRKKLTSTDEKFLLREIRADPKLTSAHLNSKLITFSGTIVSDETIRTTLAKYDINSRVARNKPSLSKINIKKRLAFAKKYKDKDKI